MSKAITPRKPIVLPPGAGRAYPMGRIQAVFKADGAESAERYSISEWWLEPRTTGPGAHAHSEDDVFYVPTVTYGSPARELPFFAIDQRPQSGRA